MRAVRRLLGPRIWPCNCARVICWADRVTSIFIVSGWRAAHVPLCEGVAGKYYFEITPTPEIIRSRFSSRSLGGSPPGTALLRRVLHAGLSWRAARNTAARNTEDCPSGLRWQLSHQAAPELAGRLSRRGDSVNDVMHTVLHGACESMPMADKIAPNGNSAVLDPADEQLARILVLMWSLASGRRLPSAVRPDELSAEELIEFWADDLRPATGRHARGSARDKAAALSCCSVIAPQGAIRDLRREFRVRLTT
jgi:hypothetical protein